jgi:phage anti-repressor protein
MTTMDIVNLIESNPITKLNGNYQSKLIDKMKNNFSNYEQQLFVTSFYSYLNYDANKDFVIDLDNVWKWLGFSQKVNAKRVLEKNFTKNRDYKLSLCQLAKQIKGGHNKETFMLNINTFKKFCLKAETKKANEIHDYYIKLEETLHEVVNEESEELKQQLNQIKNEMSQTETKVKKEYEEKLIQEKALEKQNLLLREFGHAGSLVYIIKVKSYETGEYVIKIGESRRGVEARYNEHKTKYEEVLLLDCFMVNRSKDFENFLHHHKDICINQVNDLQGHENENELFLVGKNLTYKMILNIIKNNINRFNDIDYQSLRNDIETIKNIVSKQHQNEILHDKNIIKQLSENQTMLLQKITNLEKTNKEILEKLNSSHTRTTTNFGQPLPTIGPRLQKINPETLQLIKVYETVSECMKEDNSIKRPSIHKAIEENTIYKGFRWMYVDRELDPNIVNIKPTKKTKSQNLGYIAKLNSDKTKILNIYIDRKTAAIQNNYPSTSSLDNPVKNGTITNNHYYLLYDTCDNELKQHFIKENGEPFLYRDGVGQYDEQNNLLREFACKYDCIRKLCISDKTLAKTLDKNIPYNGFYYKSIGSKLQY